MRILFYDTKKYDRDSFEKVTVKYPEIEIEYTDTDINSKTANLAKGYKAICAFVSSDVGKETIDCLSKNGVELVLLRCAGFNNVDLEEAKKKNIMIRVQKWILLFEDVFALFPFLILYHMILED